MQDKYSKTSNPKIVLMDQEVEIIPCHHISCGSRGGMQPVDVPKGVMASVQGLTAFCDSERSQMRNRDIAVSMLKAGLRAIELRRDEHAETT